MKKTVSLLLLFAVLLTLFCACKKNDETQPTSSPEPTTWGLILDELPDIGKYKSADSPRMFDKYVDNLIPRSDYGELMPYLGSVVQYENVKGEDEYMSEMIRGYYGLCTVDGVIVTDPVYDSIEYCDGYYLLEKCYRKDDLYLADYFLIPKDGSSMFEFPKKKSAFYCGDGVFGCCDSLFESVAASETSYYSATGKYLFTVDENSVVSDFFNGTALLSVYGYQAYRHYHDGKSLYIHQPKPELTTAENILHILRPDSKFSPLEAKLLDIALILHMEHGGGNNSTFTTHLVSSSGTDTYSVIAASLGSLKGPKHGGANIKVVRMFDDMKANLKDWTDEEEISRYLTALLHKEAFDHAGLIYGMGHAVYSLSDPRAQIFRGFVKRLSAEKGYEKEFALYTAVERLAPQIIAAERKIYKGVSPNVDFFSGFAYSMLGLPVELYTPIFAIARIAGWSAHRLEEVAGGGKIMRPAYKNVGEHKIYVPMDERV